MKKWIIRILIAAILASAVVYYLMDKEEEKISFMYADF